MPDEAVVGEQAAQVRVALEQDAEHVEGLALEPIDAGPDAGHRIHHGFGVIGAKHAQAQPLVERDRKQMVHNGKAAPDGHGRIERRAARDAAAEPR